MHCIGANAMDRRTPQRTCSSPVFLSVRVLARQTHARAPFGFSEAAACARQTSATGAGPPLLRLHDVRPGETHGDGLIVVSCVNLCIPAFACAFVGSA
mmetsp:Transcript_5823/g.15789  ORF Transcript_5823/g.15789 Transcript_5823/m.15789 type:complete len:98 (+) Transcript_5823:336-629(+)